jgi:hypothetical protein
LRARYSALSAPVTRQFLSVHDEIIAETPEDFGSVEEFLRLMTVLPTWADDFPLKAEGGSAVRYGKS